MEWWTGQDSFIPLVRRSLGAGGSLPAGPPSEARRAKEGGGRVGGPVLLVPPALSPETSGPKGAKAGKPKGPVAFAMDIEPSDNF